jgi:DNA-directed RNA polymerase subunit RPC12/RpoP
MRQISGVPGTEYRVRSAEHNEEIFALTDSEEDWEKRGGEQVTFISLDAPFAQFLAGISEGESRVFRDRDGSEIEYEILSVHRPPIDKSSYLSQLRDAVLHGVSAHKLCTSERSGAADLLSRDEFWCSLGPQEWTNPLALATEIEFDGPFPQVQPQGNLLRLFIEQDNVPEGIVDYWRKLPDQTRSLVVVAIIKGNIPWTQAQVILRFLLDLVINSRSQGEQEAFLKFNRELQNFVVQKAWKSAGAIDLTPLLPPCAYGKYVHCEAQDWEKMRDKGTVWCRGGPCERSHMTGNMELPLNKWSLPEILQALNIEPPVEVVSNPREYVTKLGGWINRLNDIRDRLKCSTCSEFMRPHGSYSKNLARYHTTVAHCTNPKCPDSGKGVYLSHCWACHEVIDSSRETPIRVEGRYLCAHCGSGPRESDTYSQGDRCPACGSENMAPVGKGHRFVCQDCSHSIELSPRWAFTGPRSQSVDTGE